MLTCDGIVTMMHSCTHAAIRTQLETQRIAVWLATPSDSIPSDSVSRLDLIILSHGSSRSTQNSDMQSRRKRWPHSTYVARVQSICLGRVQNTHTGRVRSTCV